MVFLMKKDIFLVAMKSLILRLKGHKIGLSICEDIWINESKYLNKDIQFTFKSFRFSLYNQ